MTQVALYVEGFAVARAWGESPLERLWKTLATRVYPQAEVEVIGISKGHIESLRFDRATKLATAEARKGIRGTYIASKNEWGHRFVTAAKDNAALLRHPIATRLATLLA